MLSHFKFWRQDLSASIIVFFVALPLCLGIGLASTNIVGIKVSPLSGLISGIIGGIVVGFISRARLGVSGPAAGLITIVLAAISTLGSFQGFLTALILAGFIQIVFAYLKAGIIANYLPSGVIKGMLAAIGITLILKEIPHLIGYDKDFFGDDSFFQFDGHNTFSELIYAIKDFDPGIALIGLLSLGLLAIIQRTKLKTLRIFKIIPPILLVIMIGTVLNFIFSFTGNKLQIANQHMVQIPSFSSFSDFKSALTFPDFTFLFQYKTYLVAFSISIVASLETLLSIEAIDSLDTQSESTPTNRELLAQGVGNVFSGFIGGIPITQVIIRSNANLEGGGKTKLSAILHGLWLLFAVLFFAPFLNHIPLASLAAILVSVGYKLTNVKMIKNQFSRGWDQFIPFVVTIFAILFTDLIIGIGIGLFVAGFYILKRNFKSNYSIHSKLNQIELRMGENVNFLNIASIKNDLYSIKENSFVLINTKNSKYLDYDIQELLQNFITKVAIQKKITVKYEGLPLDKFNNN